MRPHGRKRLNEFSKPRTIHAPHVRQIEDEPVVASLEGLPYGVQHRHRPRPAHQIPADRQHHHIADGPLFDSHDALLLLDVGPMSRRATQEVTTAVRRIDSMMAGRLPFVGRRRRRRRITHFAWRQFDHRLLHLERRARLHEDVLRHRLVPWQIQSDRVAARRRAPTRLSSCAL